MSSSSLSGIRLGPTTLHGATIVLRPPRVDDFAQWRRIRLRDQRYIEPFWSSSPLDWNARHTGRLWVRECLSVRAEARAGHRLSLVIEVDGRFAGQIELVSIETATGSAEMGLWVDAQVARHGIGGLASSMALDFGFGPAGLQRITAPISPANLATARGAAQLGFQREAMMTRYFDVGGARRDHELWAITNAAIPPNGFARHWIDNHAVQHPEITPPAAADTSADIPLSRTTVLVSVARHCAGRALHRFDPLRTPASVRLTDSGDPTVVLRSRRLLDWASWRAARISTRNALDPDLTAPGAAWARQHGRWRWLREFLFARPGLRSMRGLVLAIAVDGDYAGECRLFDLDMFDRNARMFVWTDPAVAGERVRIAATRLLLDHAFTTLGLCRVATAIEPGDVHAADVAARVGMVREGRMHCFVGATGRRADYDLWAVTTPIDQT
ncbi:GNAT family N-acetyltransferase [Nocardia sp. NBC_00565]|uniref:GNAT family N-acetyltransferase n=1 Tax=Nocardia sp. NBC_00565 TaxID=2975993 RepID=UPI002E819379|nr:GNAT family protein [Nocardia sp. NBC_00565]WUC05227.1 GNAT family N-acetyltransferase [Nocardia sp. NBC_00565]